MEILDDIPFEADVDSLLSKVGIEKGGEDAEIVTGLVEKVKDLIRPKALYDVCFVEHKGERTVKFGGANLPAACCASTWISRKGFSRSS